MQPKSSILSPVVVILTALVILGLFFLSGIRPALAQKLSGQNPEPNQATDTAAPTLADTPSNTTEPTFAPSPTIVTQAPPAPTVTQQPTPTEITQATTTYERPLIVVESYSTDADTISPGDQFELSVKVANKGQGTAHNIVAVFTPAELTPLGTGGVKAIGRIAPGNHGHFTQEFTLSYDAYGKAFTSIDMTITYTSDDGTSYSDKFTITVPVYTPSGVYATATPTMTPTSPPILRPQLVISSFTADSPILQPGIQFKLELNVQNLGNADAKRVTMIFGGGTSTGGETGGTPGPGGTSGGGGDLSNFAPLGSSNIQSLGDLAAGAALTVRQALIVNVSTNPGAYSMKVSFSYLDERGRNFTDDQVITLLVYSLPQVSVEFYRDVGPVYAGQLVQLPIQIVNQGRKSTILGNMRVTADNAVLANNTILVGALDPGNYFPLDAMLTPNQPGPLDLTITVDYTDDFNQPKKITQTLHVDVLEAIPIEPGINGPGKDGGTVEPQPLPAETFLDKVWRFLRGLIGLDSGIAVPSGPGGVGTESVPGSSSPVIQPERPLKGP